MRSTRYRAKWSQPSTPFHRDDHYKTFNDRILHEATKLATACNAELDVVYAYDLSSISSDEFGFVTTARRFFLDPATRHCMTHSWRPSTNWPNAMASRRTATAHDHG